jgi:diguanylate cyclase (GGDEF)-like protein
MSNKHLNSAVDEYCTLDAYLCGAMVSDNLRKIVYVNSYFSDELNLPTKSLVGSDIYTLFTHSSKIFCESFLIPILIEERKCEELQLALIDGNGKRIPIVINARMKEGGFIYWSFFNASKRDKLYEELIKARAELEQKAKELKELSSIDELTGLLNRREINQRAALLLEEAAMARRHTSILLIDIDHFKNVNDTLGHLKGDKVLVDLGSLLKSFGRKFDLISRYGGEEFFFILPETDLPEAKRFSKRLHNAIAAIEISGKPLTVSIGISVSDGSDNKSLTELYRQSDEALYKAKK